MEFYELNRLYDASLQCMSVSRVVDQALYSFMPVFVSLGCGVSLLTVLVLLHSNFTPTSKNYLVAQCSCNFLFQFVSAIVLITNNYEKGLFEYFNSHLSKYLLFKTYLNFAYNVLLYSVIWLFTVGCLDFSVLSIIKLGSLSSYLKVYYKLFIQQVSQYHGFCNSTRSGVATPKVSLTTSDIDEAALYEIDNSEDINFNYSNWAKNEDNLFCNSKKIGTSLFIIGVFSVMMAMPHYFAYEVKPNSVSVSPSPMPKVVNDELKNILNNIYFIKEQVPHSRGHRIKNRKNSTPLTTTNYFYSHNMAKAYGLTLVINDSQLIKLAKIRKTHPKFFNVSGAFDLASRHYRLCNTLENKNKWRPVRNKNDKIDYMGMNKINIDNYLQNIVIINVTLLCIKKNEMNGYLAYNTLYFWLEHTIVVSVPIFINTVVAVAMGMTFWKALKLLVEQTRIEIKRKQMNEFLGQICQQNQNQNLSVNRAKVVKNQCPGSSSNYDRSPNKRNSSARKCVQIQDMTDIILSDYEDDVFYDPVTSHAEIKNQIVVESQVHRSQREFNQLNLMFLVDLGLFILIAFPYTFMRLVLDLFSKDRIKFNLDFFILYKIAFLSFHLHLIAKFVLLTCCSVKFRLAFASIFAVNPSICCIGEEDYETEQSGCFFLRKINEADQGEYFNVNLHTKMASNYDQSVTRKNSPDQISVHIDFDDDKLVRTDV